MRTSGGKGRRPSSADGVPAASTSRRAFEPQAWSLNKIRPLSQSTIISCRTEVRRMAARFAFLSKLPRYLGPSLQSLPYHLRPKRLLQLSAIGPQKQRLVPSRSSVPHGPLLPLPLLRPRDQHPQRDEAKLLGPNECVRRGSAAPAGRFTPLYSSSISSPRARRRTRRKRRNRSRPGRRRDSISEFLSLFYSSGSRPSQLTTPTSSPPCSPAELPSLRPRTSSGDTLPPRRRRTTRS